MLSQKMFCRYCRSVTEHGIYAKERYSTYGGMAPRIPLLCICGVCDTLLVAFSQEFYFCRQIKGEYAKVYGYNRIMPGNWVYFKGDSKPGVVKSCFQTSNKEILEVSYDGGSPQRLECPKVNVTVEEAPQGYRLLPAQSPCTLIGDHVFHVLRNMFGVSVGLVNDGVKDKLAVLLEDGTILFITLPALYQNESNEKLVEQVRGKLNQVLPEDAKKVTVEVGQGIVYLSGLSKNLLTRRTLRACAEGVMKVRGCVDSLKVVTDGITSDQDLAERLYGVIENSGYYLFDMSVKVENLKADIRLHCLDNNIPKDLEKRLAQVPSLQDMNFTMIPVVTDSLENSWQCKEMEQDLATNSITKNAFVRITYLRGKYLIEGRVHSLLQKQVVLFSVLKTVKTTAIENRLRVLT